MKAVYLIWVLALSILMGGMGCSVNVLETFANKTTDEAKIVDAQDLLDDGNYDGALEILLNLSESAQERREVRAMIASAYAGRAGLNFLDLIDSFQGAGSAKLFPFLMQAFSGGTVAKITDAGLAEDQMALITTDASERSQDENVLMALINFQKMGNILSEYADNNNDGTRDGTFNACPNANTPGTNVPDTQVREFGLSLIFALNSLSQVSDNFASGVLGSVSSCTAIEALDDSMGSHPLDGMCDITDPADFTNLHLLGFRSLMKESNAVGLGQCTGGISACNCP